MQRPKKDSVKKVMFASKDMQLGSTGQSNASSNNNTIMARGSNLESMGLDNRYENLGRHDSSLTYMEAVGAGASDAFMRRNDSNMSTTEMYMGNTQ